MSKKPKNHPYSWIVTLSLGLICAIEMITPAANALEFPSSPDRTPPKSTAAGGRRGGCVSGRYPIWVFTPGDDNYINTISSQPQLFVYLPETKAKYLQLTIQEENGKKIDFQEIPINQDDSIVKISPSDTVELEVGKKYQWAVSLVCNPMVINRGNYTTGIIERVALTTELEAELAKTQDVLKQAKIYSNQYIWSETISLIATLKESQPEEWKELLASVGLKDFGDKEIQEP